MSSSLERRHTYPYRCNNCGTSCATLTALRDHPCTNQDFTERSNVDMGNVGVCDKCGKVFKTDVMADVLIRYNPQLPSIERKLCPKDAKQLHGWFQDSPVSENASKPFDPADLDSDTAKAIES